LERPHPHDPPTAAPHRLLDTRTSPGHTVSCPIVFAWDGGKYRYIGDYLGVGGLGYLEAPGMYSKADPTEVLELPGLAVAEGPGGAELRVSLVEPLEECAYLDSLDLVAADTPPGVTVHPDEIFRVRAPAPGARLLAYREELLPAKAVDGKGRAVTEELRRIDRIYEENWKRDRRFPGTAERHEVALEFERDLPRGSGDARPHLFIYGYVEYGYSTSNFAASQAGVGLHAPTVSVERGGKWVVLREEWGFPGGTPRWMAVDLGGLLEPGDRRLRIETDMEVYFDQVFVAEATPVEIRGQTTDFAGPDPSSGPVRVTALGASRAELRYRGFPRDRSPDGRHPKVYDYDDVGPEEMKPFPGRYTSYGDVRDLVAGADDRLAVMGEGDEVLLGFRAADLPPLPEGWTRTYFLSGTGWCKDMDLYTAASDRVEPLPFRSMTDYPPPAGEAPPEEAARENAARSGRVVEPLAIGSEP
jgi:hypothetical protein